MPSGLINALNILKESQRYNQWIYSVVEPYLIGVVLDVGSGLGDIASLFNRPQVKEVILSDCDENLVAQLRQRSFALPRYRIISLDITQDTAIAQLNGVKVDTVTCVNVLEHIEDDLSALRRMLSMLKPRGRAVILVPALPSIYGTLDSCHGHKRRYTAETLRVKIQSAGFHIEACRFMNILGVLSWFLAGRVLKQKQFSKKTCYQLDKIVPLLRRIERGVRLPWGQSLMVVGRLP